MPATAARVLIDTLRLHGVDRFFCVPGESYLAVMNELVDHPVIDVVTCRHEGGAAFMALADAKCTGRPGIVFASRGPGAANASVAIHSASQGAVPMVVFLGQVGTRLGAVPTLGWSFPKPGQRLVHVYPDPGQIGTRHATDLGVIADPVPFLRALGERNAPPLPEGRRAWLAGAHRAWAEAAGAKPIDAEDGIDFGHVIEAMKGLVPKDAVITSDAGNFMSWLHHRYPFEPTQLLLGSEIGAMGMGIPAAVAAAIRFPGRQVVALAGDGGALMTGSELATAVMRKARVRVIVANNNHYGTIRFHQEVHFPGRAHYANELVNPDFAAYAESFGARGFRVDRPEDAAPALEAALAVDGPAVIDVRTSLEKITSATTLAEMRRAAAE